LGCRWPFSPEIWRSFRYFNVLIDNNRGKASAIVKKSAKA
jgi:hypothetical protein